MALQVCDLAYRASQSPALRVNQLSVSFTSTLESHHCWRTAPNCGGYLSYLIPSLSEAHGLDRLFVLPDSLHHSLQSLVKIRSTLLRVLKQADFVLSLCFCVSVTSPSFSSGFQISKKDVPSFLRPTSPLVFWVIFPPTFFWPSLSQWSASSSLHPSGVYDVYSLNTHTLNACCCPSELW